MANEGLVRRILVEIDRNPSVSQRQLSTELGVSIGIVNWHMKRFVKKGLVKLHQAPVRRYLYYLTPDGFAEKAKLTAEYLKSSFNIFRLGRRQYEALFGLCEVNHWSRRAVAGQQRARGTRLHCASPESSEVTGSTPSLIRRSARRLPWKTSRPQRRWSDALARVSQTDAWMRWSVLTSSCASRNAMISKQFAHEDRNRSVSVSYTGVSCNKRTMNTPDAVWIAVATQRECGSTGSSSNWNARVMSATARCTRRPAAPLPARCNDSVKRPFFPGYVFVRLDRTRDQWRPIMYSRGVRIRRAVRRADSGSSPPAWSKV